MSHILQRPRARSSVAQHKAHRESSTDVQGPPSAQLCLPKLRSRSRQSWAGSFPFPPRARQGRGARSRPHLSAPYLKSPQMHSSPATILRAAAPPSAGSALRLGAGPTRQLPLSHWLSTEMDGGDRNEREQEWAGTRSGSGPM